MRIARSLALAIAGALALAVTDATAAPPSREVIAVIVGANQGSASEETLRYATSDARRVRDLVTELGEVLPGNAVLLAPDAPDQVLGALRTAKQRAAALVDAHKEVTLVFYYSGHGDDEAIHLPKGTLPLKALRAAIADVPADLHVSILDACRTSGRAKGITLGPGFDVNGAPEQPKGTVELRASAAGEAAQESDELAGGVFTHFLVSGLRGAADTDGDGRVTLGELVAWVYRRTLLRTTATPVLQHPSASIDLAGSGELVLTAPGRATAFLEVPTGSERYLVFARAGNAAMGELSGDGVARIALPAGKFVVVRRTATATSIAAVDLSAGGTKRVGDADFKPITREELVRRRGDIELRPLHVDARVGGEVAPGAADRFAVRGGGAFGYADGALELELEAMYVGGPFASDAFEGFDHAIAVGPNVGLRETFGRFTLAGLVGVDLRYTWQRLARSDADRAAAAAFPARELRTFGAAGPRASVRLGVALGGDVTLSLAIGYEALLRREIATENLQESEPIRLHSRLTSTIGVGYAF